MPRELIHHSAGYEKVIYRQRARSGIFLRNIVEHRELAHVLTVRQLARVIWKQRRKHVVPWPG